MPRTIVCGVDDSEAAVAVADTARWLADGLDSHLVLVHVAEEPGQTPEEVLTSIRVRLGLGQSDDLRLLEGVPTSSLIDSAEEHDAELLVVGSRGRSSIRSAVLGSVSRTLATSARCPVVIAPASSGDPGKIETDGEQASVVCGVDGSDHARAAARLAGGLAARMGLRLIVVHALPDVKSLVSYPGGRSTAPPLSGQPDARARLADEVVEDAVAEVEGDATAVVEPGPPWEVLEAVADREAGRLIAVAARGHGGLRTVVFGSVASHLATSARRPLVVLPERAERRVAG